MAISQAINACEEAIRAASLSPLPVPPAAQIPALGQLFTAELMDYLGTAIGYATHGNSSVMLKDTMWAQVQARVISGTHVSDYSVAWL